MNLIDQVLFDSFIDGAFVKLLLPRGFVCFTLDVSIDLCAYMVGEDSINVHYLCA